MRGRIGTFAVTWKTSRFRRFSNAVGAVECFHCSCKRSESANSNAKTLGKVAKVAGKRHGFCFDCASTARLAAANVFKINMCLWNARTAKKCLCYVKT